jgi:hypothetical protein
VHGISGALCPEDHTGRLPISHFPCDKDVNRQNADRALRNSWILHVARAAPRMGSSRYGRGGSKRCGRRRHALNIIGAPRSFAAPSRHAKLTRQCLPLHGPSLHARTRCETDESAAQKQASKLPAGDPEGQIRTPLGRRNAFRGNFKPFVRTVFPA